MFCFCSQRYKAFIVQSPSRPSTELIPLLPLPFTFFLNSGSAFFLVVLLPPTGPT